MAVELPFTAVSLDSFDPESMSETIQHSALEHVQLAPGRFIGRFMQSSSRNIQIAFGSYNKPMLAKGSMSSDEITLGFLMRSPGETTFYCEPAPEGTVAVWGKSTEMHTMLAPNSQWFTLQIGHDALNAAGIELPESTRDHYPTDRVTGANVAGGVRAALRELDNIHSTRGSQSCFEVVMDELADHMVCALGSILATQSFARKGSVGARRRREAAILDRAESYIDAKLAENITIRDICSEIECPIHTLERVFRKSLGVTPRQFLTFRRLAELRRHLISASGQDVSVASAAITCGLTHLGRTAAWYSRIYGELPSETLKTPVPPAIPNPNSVAWSLATFDPNRSGF